MAQLVEYDLAKVGVAGSSPVSRFFYFKGLVVYKAFCFTKNLKTDLKMILK